MTAPAVLGPEPVVGIAARKLPTRMQPTGRTGAELHAVGTFWWRRQGSVILCGRGPEGPQLMRVSLGRTCFSPEIPCAAQVS
jgi:hypothetical protein